MEEQFYTILTNIGKAKMANAGAMGQKLDFRYVALGDGNGKYYNPVESQTELKNEVWRGLIGNVATDESNPHWILVENMIPASVGGFMIRELGIFDNEVNLLAIGKYPETYKPLIENGSAKDLIIKMILEVSNTSAVTLKIDPTIILATKKDIDVLSNRIKKNEDDIKELKQGSTIMEDLQTENKTLAGAINEALDKANQAFQSASDGKTIIASSITAKGVSASKEDTFPTLASKIDSIETDKTGDATATITPTTSPQTIAANQYLSGAQTIAGVSIPVANVLVGVTIAGAMGTMPNRGALNQTITSNNGQVNIAAGYYTGGVVKAILIASNIKEGVNIGGVVGTFVPIQAPQITTWGEGIKTNTTITLPIRTVIGSSSVLIRTSYNNLPSPDTWRRISRGGSLIIYIGPHGTFRVEFTSEGVLQLYYSTTSSVGESYFGLEYAYCS